ncbi:nucleoside/nucleotide kinase family protein [Nigerium massiliense]|uniref:hypothetical protein n=1 Tax=Nigerium massiliense TaxID=1522317 RepID=UPI0006941E38|nr:hypothetical protein [Nigerium massiliense]
MTLTELVAWLTRPGRAAVLIDGGSGSGKTSYAHRLAEEWPRPVQLVSLDALYPGWDGLAAGAAAVPGILSPLTPGYRTWDWRRGAPGERVTLDPTVDVVVEGCGSLTPANRALATAALWLDLDAAERRRRALDRDQDAYVPYWDRWAAQEAEHWAAHRPWELADAVVADGVITRPPLDWAQWAAGR